MSGITATSQGDAVTFQERYQRLLQELAEAFVNSLQQVEKQKDNVLLIDSKEIVYGEVNGVFVNNLSSEKAEELKQVLQTPAGGTVEGATAKAMYVDGKEVLRSDENGNVLVNKVIENPALQVRLGLNPSRGSANAVVETQVTQSTAGSSNEESVTFQSWNVLQPPDIEEDDRWMYAREASVQPSVSPRSVQVPITATHELTSEERLVKWREALANGDPQAMRDAVSDLPKESKVELYSRLDKEELIAAFALAIAAGLTQNPAAVIEKQQSQTSAQIDVTASLDDATELGVQYASNQQGRVEQQVVAAEVSASAFASAPVSQQQSYDAVAALSQSVSALSPEIQRQLAEPLAAMQQAQQTAATQSMTPEQQALLEQRLQEPSSTTWWEGVKNKAIYLFQEIRHRLQESSAAVAIRDLCDEKLADSGNGTYETDKYSITKQGSIYTLKDERDRDLIRFQSGPAGLILMESTKLSDSQRQDLDQLVQQQSKGREPTGAFAAVGTREAQQFERINRITQALTNYAARCGKEVYVAGNDYTWTANPNGSIKIEKTNAPQEEKLLLMASSGSHVSKLGERDMKHFETMIKFMEKSPQSQQKVKASLER